MVENKTLFRQTQRWKLFRLHQMNTIEHCELCGSVYSGKRKKKYNLHHLDESNKNYDILIDKRFRLLCSDCHMKIENMMIRFNKNRDMIPTTTRVLWWLLLNSIGLFQYQGGHNFVVKDENKTISAIDFYKRKQEINKSVQAIDIFKIN